MGGPKQAFYEKALKEIDSFLMKGKGAIFLVDVMAMNATQGNMHELQQMQPQIGQPNNLRGSTRCSKYGFKIQGELHLRRQAKRARHRRVPAAAR